MLPSRLSPPASPTGTSANPMLEARHTAGAKRYKYLRRILKFRQMDFEFALWQMLYLCVAPQRVYRNFHYRKQTKDQWARDDPAFLVLLSFWLCASSLGFAIVLQLSIMGMIKLLLWVIFVDCIGVGLMVATLLWFVANKYLQTQKSDQEVEWGYAFDVHLNAFFPLLIILHVIQLFFIHPLIDKEWFMSRLFGNTLWLIALGYYLYITFLGYSSLPFLRHTVVLLYPAMLIILTFYIVSLPVGWNFTQGLMWFYRYRVGHYV